MFGSGRLSVFIPGSLLVLWLSSVARPCATRDENNIDNVCKPTTPAGINRPPPSETITHVTRVPNHKTRGVGLKAVADDIRENHLLHFHEMETR